MRWSLAVWVSGAVITAWVLVLLILGISDYLGRGIKVSRCTFSNSDDISDTPQDTESEESDDLPARLARIDSVCEKYADLLWTDPTDDRASWDRKYCGRDVCSFYLVERRRFGFCPIPKAATSSLKTLILEAERIKDPGDNADEIFLEFKKRFPSVLPCPHWDKKLGSEYGKLIIVRHPFERLVSAYVDKIRTTDPFIPGAKAMYKHGFVGKGPNGTFTFSEFVSNILKEPVEKWDEHWAPFTTRCRPCSMRYNVIAKVETLDQDLKTLLPRIGLPRWTFPARNVKTRSNESSRKEFSHYISELPRQQLLQLHAIYMYDFELFGYKLAGYTDPVL